MTETESNEGPPPSRSPSALSIRGLAGSAGFLVCLFTVTGFAGGWFWMFEVTSHFRIQYAAILFVLAVGFFCLKRWRPGTVFALFGLMNGWLLLPYWSFTEARSATTGSSIKLLAWNVNSSNDHFGELPILLDQETPDLVLLMEVSPSWAQFIETSLTNYPHQQVTARDDNFGIALLSRLPLEDVQTLYLGKAGVPSIQARLSVDRKTVSLLGTHPLPPAGGLRSLLRDEQLGVVTKWVNQQTHAVIVVGDLNATPWSPVFQEFTRSTHLVNSAEGRAIQGTWPAFFKPLLIPIDHFLHSDEVTVARREILAASGSDHLPQVVEFGWAERSVSP